jgi:hypothetical protein
MLLFMAVKMGVALSKRGAQAGLPSIQASRLSRSIRRRPCRKDRTALALTARSSVLSESPQYLAASFTVRYFG